MALCSIFIFQEAFPYLRARQSFYGHFPSDDTACGSRQNMSKFLKFDLLFG
jgi:hypothetical protein